MNPVWKENPESDAKAQDKGSKQLKLKVVYGHSHKQPNEILKYCWSLDVSAAGTLNC